MRIAIILGLVVGLSACSFFKKPGCFIQEQVVAVAGDAIASTLECNNRESIRKDLNGIVSGIGICDASPTGPLADSLCPMVSAAILNFVTDHTIPAEWGCTAISAKAKLGEALNVACKKIPVKVTK